MIIRALKKLVKKHKTIPAPKFLEDDPWFGPATLSKLGEKQQEYVRSDVSTRRRNHNSSLKVEDQSPTKEVDNIHEVMYNIATSGGKTTTQLN